MTLDEFLDDIYKGKPEERAKMEKEADKLIAIGDIISAMIELRKKAGLSQVEVAKKMNVLPPFINRIEQGDIDIRLSTVVKYLEAVKQTMKQKKSNKKYNLDKLASDIDRVGNNFGDYIEDFIEITDKKTGKTIKSIIYTVINIGNNNRK